MGAILDDAIVTAINNLSTKLKITHDFDLGVWLDELAESVQAGNLGIKSDSVAVDAVCKDTLAVQIDRDNTSGLELRWLAGKIRYGGTVVPVAAGHVHLTASQTNYLEVYEALVEGYPAGVVVANTTGFSAGRIPLWSIVAGSSSFDIDDAVTNCRVLLASWQDGVISGNLLSTAGKTKTLPFRLGTLTKDTVDTYLLVIAPNFAGTFSGVRLAVKTAVPKNDTDYWTITCVNKSNSDKAMLAASPDNTTMNTGGFPLVAYTAKPLNLHGTAGNLVTAALDCLLFRITRAGTVATTYDLVDATVEFDFTHEV